MKSEILIIDDDQDMVEALKIILEGESYTVRVALNGQEGLKAVKQKKPDLIILDLLLPGEDGISIYRSLKNYSEYQDIPVLVLTALAKKMGGKVFSKKGEFFLREVDEYLEKPVNPQSLLEKIRKLLKGKIKGTN